MQKKTIDKKNKFFKPLFTYVLFFENYSITILYKNKKYFLYIYNKNFNIILKLYNNPTILNTNSIFLKNGFLKKNLFKNIGVFLNQFFIYSFTKIKFTGKGYKIKKNKKSNFKLLFNRAHFTYVWWECIFLKKIKKYKIYLRFLPKNNDVINSILNIRKVNIFTKKGLRESRQILYKKKGKK